MRRTKIICTVGPASESTEMLRKLVQAGTDVFRLNFSHGTVTKHQAVIRRIRAVGLWSSRMARMAEMTGTIGGGNTARAP
jgi:pyruvate kinase